MMLLDSTTYPHEGVLDLMGQAPDGNGARVVRITIPNPAELLPGQFVKVKFKTPNPMSY
jgi:hypothetical protein